MKDRIGALIRQKYSYAREERPERRNWFKVVRFSKAEDKAFRERCQKDGVKQSAKLRELAMAYAAE